MRAVAWLLILIAGFGLVAKLHNDRIAHDRAVRDQAWDGAGRPESEAWKQPLPDGWTRVLLGRPAHAAGAELETNIPLMDWRDVRPNPELPVAPPVGVTEIVQPTEHSSFLPVDFEHEVREGQTLSAICARFYDNSGLRLVEAVAEYNSIHADEIQAGQLILLPEAEKLRLD